MALKAVYLLPYLPVPCICLSFKLLSTVIPRIRNSVVPKPHRVFVQNKVRLSLVKAIPFLIFVYKTDSHFFLFHNETLKSIHA